MARRSRHARTSTFLAGTAIVTCRQLTGTALADRTVPRWRRAGTSDAHGASIAAVARRAVGVSPASLPSDSLPRRGTPPASDEHATPAGRRPSTVRRRPHRTPAHRGTGRDRPGRRNGPRRAQPTRSPSQLRELIAQQAVRATRSRASPIATRSRRSIKKRATSARCGSTPKARPSARKIAIDYLRTVDADGLDPRRLSGAELRRRRAGTSRDRHRITAMLLPYARHAMNGRVHFSRVSRERRLQIGVRRRRRAERRSYPRDDLATTLQRFNPQHPAYKALKGKLAELRAAGGRRGAALRQRPGAALCPRRGNAATHDDRSARADAARAARPRRPSRTCTTTTQLADAVAKFQEEAGLQPTGQLERRHHRCAQRAEPRQADRRHPRRRWSAGAGCRASSAAATSC